MGFMVGGYLLGSDQGLQDARDIRVRLADGTRVPVTLVRSFNVYGIAVLKMKTTSSPPKPGLLLGDFSKLARGDTLYSLDLSQSSSPALEKGRLLEISRAREVLGYEPTFPGTLAGISAAYEEVFAGRKSAYLRSGGITTVRAG